MNRSFFSRALKMIGMAFILPVMILIACSSGEEDEQSKAEKQSSTDQKSAFPDSAGVKPGYENWHKHSTEFLIVYCPPDSALIERVPAIAKRIKEVIMENAVRLDVQIPIPSIFFLYNNNLELQELTDCQNTCVRGNIFHYMIFTPLGEPIMERLLRDFDMDGCPYRFCHEGLVTYLNYSGENYVEKGYIHYYNEKLPSLSDMIDNEKYLAIDSTVRTESAASLIEYLLAEPWSPDMVLSLYRRNDADAAQALKAIYDMSVEELEKGWHEYLKEKSGFNLEY